MSILSWRDVPYWLSSPTEAIEQLRVAHCRPWKQASVRAVFLLVSIWALVSLPISRKVRLQKGGYSQLKSGSNDCLTWIAPPFTLVAPVPLAFSPEKVKKILLMSQKSQTLLFRGNGYRKEFSIKIVSLQIQAIAPGDWEKKELSPEPGFSSRLLREGEGRCKRGGRRGRKRKILIDGMVDWFSSTLVDRKGGKKNSEGHCSGAITPDFTIIKRSQSRGKNWHTQYFPDTKLKLTTHKVKRSEHKVVLRAI